MIIADIVIFFTIFFGLTVMLGTYRGIKKYRSYFKEPNLVWFFSVTDPEFISFHNSLMKSIDDANQRIRDSQSEFEKETGKENKSFDASIYDFYSGSISLHKKFYLFNTMINSDGYIVSLILDPKSGQGFQINTKILKELHDLINDEDYKDNTDLYKYIHDVDGGYIGDIILLEKFTKQLNKYKGKYTIDNIISTNQGIVEIDMLNKLYLNHVLKNKVEKSVEEKPTE